MKKRLSVIDFEIRDSWAIQYVDWAELKFRLWTEDYLKLLRFITKKWVFCLQEWLQIEILKEFLSSIES